MALALWLGISSDSFEGKVIGLWAPITTFATIGYEHCLCCLVGLICQLNGERS